MDRVGILTFHYSNNYGGVLQCYALYDFIKSLGLDVEVINYIPASYKLDSFLHNVLHFTGLRKNPLLIDPEDLHPSSIFRRVYAKKKYNSKIVQKFDSFRSTFLRSSVRVDEQDIHTVLMNYSAIVVGSDQIWAPSLRHRPEYFLGFEQFNGRRISYAADSTIAGVSREHVNKLRHELLAFDKVSVRNVHSQQFVEGIISKKVPIVADPTLLCNFNGLSGEIVSGDEQYILLYVLGRDINGSNKKAIEKIKKVYGDHLKVYAIAIPTMKFNICDFADKVFYDLGPEEWLDLIRKATFVYTDSFHGTLFSLKFHKPFLAYYAEKMRATRFVDLGKRYQIDRYIVNNIEDIDVKGSLEQIPDFKVIDQIIGKHKESSICFLKRALGIER